MGMRSLTFIIRFQTAQFKLHFQKLARRTYLIPPPSAVAGIFGAILGVSRSDLKRFCKEQNILTGAELRNLEGYYVTLSRILKFDRDDKSVIKLLKEWLLREPKGKRTLSDVYRDILGLYPLKESEELFKPEYKFAIAGRDQIIKEGLRRIRDLDFKYDIFGGNDYHFVDYIGDACEAFLIKSREGRGYCPVEDVQGISAQEYNIITNTNYLSKNPTNLPLVIFAPIGPEMKSFMFVYETNIITKSEKIAVQDRESTIFIFDPCRCLVP